MRFSSQLGQGSTQVTYYHGIQRYIRFTDQLPVARRVALPPEPNLAIPQSLVQLFIVWAKDHYALSTIQNTLSALSSWHVAKGLPPLSQQDSDKQIRQTLKAVQRHLGPAGQTKQKKGISAELLKLLVDKLYGLVYQHQHSPISQMYLRDLVWLVLSYFGFLRRSEAVALNVQDVTINTGNPASPAYVGLFLRRSKTDPLGRGMQVLLAWCSASGICIGQLIALYISRLQFHQYPSHFPLFMILGLDYSLDSTNERRVAQTTLSGRLKIYLSDLAHEHPNLQIDLTSYSAHSLRRGAATSAWQAGVPREIVARHGRWQSDAVDLYLIADVDFKLTVTQKM